MCLLISVLLSNPEYLFHFSGSAQRENVWDTRDTALDGRSSVASSNR